MSGQLAENFDENFYLNILLKNFIFFNSPCQDSEKANGNTARH